MTAARVLVVDDEFFIAEYLTAMMKDMGLKVVGRAATADEAVSLASQHRPDLVLMDVRLRGSKDGIDAANAIQEIGAARFVYITGSREPATVARINTDHPATVLFKPIRFEELLDTIETVLT